MHLKGFSITVIYCNTYICTWYLEYEVLHLVETIIQICGLNYVCQNSNLPNLLYSNLSIFIKLKYTGTIKLHQAMFIYKRMALKYIH